MNLDEVIYLQIIGFHIFIISIKFIVRTSLFINNTHV